MNEKKGTRLNKYLSEIGFCSRREADKLIAQKHVRVNGKIPVSATPVKTGDKIVVHGRQLDVVDNDFIYLAFNKPVGVVCTTDETEKDNIISYVNYPKRIFPVGRLDKDSEGLIFLTSDGDIVNKILRAGNKHEKEYLVTVNKAVTDDFIDKMSNGVPIMGQRTKKCLVEAVGVNNFRIVLVQGLNRQIRRMCEYLGYEVKKLKRIRIMNIKLDVPKGEWRDLSEDELNQLKQLVEKSSKTSKKSSAKPSSSQKKRYAKSGSKPPTERARKAKPGKSGTKRKNKPTGKKRRGRSS